MRLSMPKASFKPDPQMGADALKRVTQKADNEKSLNPERAMAQMDENGVSDKLKSASTAMDVGAMVVPHPAVKAGLVAGSMACSVGAAVLERMPKSDSKASMAESVKADSGPKPAAESIDMDNFTDNSALEVSSLSTEEVMVAQQQQAQLIGLGIDPAAVQQMDIGQLRSSVEIVDEAKHAQPWQGNQENNGNSSKLDNMDKLMTVADVANSVPQGARGMDPKTLAALRNSAQEASQMGPDLV